MSMMKYLFDELEYSEMPSWLKILLYLCYPILGIALLFVAFGLVPLMVELALHNNWNGLGESNRWFYLFYLITLGVIG